MHGGQRRPIAPALLAAELFERPLPGPRGERLNDLSASLPALAIAEGIETREQLEFLVERGCPLGQGFLFGRPVPAKDVAPA